MAFGRVRGLPMPPALVSIAGTTLGATANAAGNYVIPNVPPGTYSLQGRRVGYRNVVVDSVRVAARATTNVDITAVAMRLTLSVVVGPSGPTGSRVEVCPIMALLAANAAGRIMTHSRVVNCVR
jgi:hypothetical protein